VSVRKSSGCVFARFLAIWPRSLCANAWRWNWARGSLPYLHLARGVSKAPSVKIRHLVYFRYGSYRIRVTNFDAPLSIPITKSVQDSRSSVSISILCIGQGYLVACSWSLHNTIVGSLASTTTAIATTLHPYSRRQLQTVTVPSYWLL